LFLNKSQIICRSDDDDRDAKVKEDTKSKPKSKDTNDNNDSSQDLGYKFAVNRKTGPKEERNRGKSDWKPPDWAKDYDAQDDEDDGGGFLAEKYSSMVGKKYDLKGLYGSRGHPGFKKFRNKPWNKWTEEDWKAWQAHLDEENDMIEKERRRIQQEKDDIAKLNKDLSDKARKEAEERQRRLAEEEARLRQLELDRQKEADDLDNEKKTSS